MKHELEEDDKEARSRHCFNWDSLLIRVSKGITLLLLRSFCWRNCFRKLAAGRRNRYQSKKRYRHFQERISILVLFTTLEKKKKQATDKPYCLLHNNVIRKFSCLFYFSASPRPPPCPVPSPASSLLGQVGLLYSRLPSGNRKKLVGTRRKNRTNLGTYFH